MGCWNATCAVSKLPIHANDNVICWFINTPRYSDGDGPDATNFCHPHDRYELLGLPFRAKYNDYGGFEDIHSDDQELFNIVLEEIRANMIEVELGENQSHDIAVKKADLDEELVIEAIHEGRLFIKGWGNKPCAVGLMMVHEHLLEEMIRTYTWKVYEHDPETDGYRYVMKTMNIDEIAGKIAKAAEEDSKSYFGMDNKLRRYYERMTFVADIFREFMSNSVPTQHPLYQKVIRALAYSNALDSFANVLRFAYGPQCGAGSQDGDQAPYQALISAMQSVMKKANERFGYDEDEDVE